MEMCTRIAKRHISVLDLAKKKENSGILIHPQLTTEIGTKKENKQGQKDREKIIEKFTFHHQNGNVHFF